MPYLLESGSGGGGCIFCEALEGDELDKLVLHRGRTSFVLLNRYPYSNGHAMVAPVAHEPDLPALDPVCVAEMMELLVKLEAALRAEYHAQGFNVGMNLGGCAGAGIEQHLHMHIVPRWPGDTSFMTTTAETRVLPEALEATWEKLRRHFSRTEGAAR
jgi:ATP adenylyltransferase